MSFVLMTVFTSFWTFLGTCVLLCIVFEGTALILKAIATIIKAFNGRK